MSLVVFLRRQSPDWESLSRDYRRGVPIDPARYVPDHAVPGFPSRIDGLIGAWNARFRTDFFTLRALLARISAASLAAVRGGEYYSYERIEHIAALTRRRNFYLYPHDDDDLFAPYLGEVVLAAALERDALVTPLFRIGRASWTFVPAGCEPEFVLGEPRVPHFRFQTNNYAVHSRRLANAEDIRAIKDHIEASSYAQAQGFTQGTASQVVSATVKTPASASALADAFRNRFALRRNFVCAIEGLQSLELPLQFEWIAQPCRRIAALLESVYRGESLEPFVEST